MRLRATVKIRNDRMLSARSERSMSQGDLAKAAGVSLSYVLDFEKLKFDRRKPKPTRQAAEKIALKLEIPVDEIYPEELENQAIEAERTAVVEVNPMALLAATESFKTRMIAMAPNEATTGLPTLDELIERWRREVGPFMLNSPDSMVCAKYRSPLKGFEVLKLRAAGLTLDEIGAQVGLSGARVSHYEHRAITELQKVARRDGEGISG